MALEKKIGIDIKKNENKSEKQNHIETINTF